MRSDESNPHLVWIKEKVSKGHSAGRVEDDGAQDPEDDDG